MYVPLNESGATRTCRVSVVMAAARYPSSWASRQDRGSRSSRQRSTLVPCRMRPSLTWSKETSTTSSGRSAIHSSSRSLAHRRRVRRAALAGLVRRQPVDELALLLRAEPARVPDAVDLAVLVVQAEDERADRPLRLAGPPAEDDRVDRPDPLDLHHARALAGLVGRVALLGDDALGVAAASPRRRPGRARRGSARTSARRARPRTPPAQRAARRRAARGARRRRARAGRTR